MYSYPCLIDTYLSPGLIDYNFHCFRKAIHEVFEVGVSTPWTGSQAAGTPCTKAVTLNGTPRSTV
jgi:Ras-related GTP-binding protein C/D